ncbi:endoglucanase 2 [Xylaria bambusicola]|uniref:endoglucanase 2 n=1 Tax=Xylaria bambusicola TaxID=326684 RepID=UPI0020075A41|nr:endoglucanase 2 [Xylaria bambusicola]KAI0527941.1 endoglucanase 2 [Xylaria bambusicola]
MHFSTFLSLTLLPAAFAKVQFLGVAIAGGDFGCQIDGTCPPESAQLPLNDGPNQMNHFVKEDGVNLLRIPTSWQFLVNGQLGSDLDASKLSQYDQLVQSCLDTGAYCMIDIHNFARWNGQIIGQGGPTDEQFASFWGQLAGNYATSDKIIFELMNEPHDLDVGIWAQTCQKAVTAIREAGATSQMILLPGTNFDSAATLVSSGSADALLAITNPDGSTDNLLLDIHKYLDEDNSGTHAACTTDNVDAFTTVAEYLRTKGRKGFISETGASSDASCIPAFCAQNTFINTNSDVFTGLVAWGAGSFSTSYVLSLTPTNQNGRLVDSTLMTQCVLATWNNAHSNNGTIPTPTLSSTRPTATSSKATSTIITRASTFISATSLPTPPASLTVSRGPAISHIPSNDNSSSSAAPGSTINTSDVLILTDVLPASTMTTLAIATGTPPSRSGFGGLLTAQSVPLLATPTGASTSASASSTPAAAEGGAGSIAVGALTLWSAVFVAVASLV